MSSEEKSNEANIAQERTGDITVTDEIAGLLLEGTLLKRARKRGLRGLFSAVIGLPWTERHCILWADRTLQYFDGNALKGTISLENSVAKALFGPDMYDFCFQVQDMRELCLCDKC